VVKVVFDLHVAVLLALARCDGCLDTYLMVQRTEEWLELCDCPVVGLDGHGYRLAAVHMARSRGGCRGSAFYWRIACAGGSPESE